MNVGNSIFPDPKIPATPVDLRHRARRCRAASVIILALGLISAGLVYWLRPAPPDYSDDPSTVGFNRREERQMGELYGKQGQLVEDLDNALKQPRTQAILILVASGIVSGLYFQAGRIFDRHARGTKQAE